MRMLVLHHEGAPMLASITAAAIRARILEWPDDDADLFRVWSVPTDDTHTPAADITEQFAETWAIEYRFGDGIEPADYLVPFPAFIRAAAEPKLVAKWQSLHALQHLDFVPDALRRIA